MKPMLATKYNKEQVKFPCFVQPKYDGVRCLLYEDKDGFIRLMSRGGKEYDVPQIKEWAEHHRSLLPLDGEIYNHNELTFQQICSAVKCKTELTAKLKMVVYDKPVKEQGFEMRFTNLKCDIPADKTIWPVYRSMTYMCHSEEQIKELHDKFVKQGYEGAIIRNIGHGYIEGLSNDLMKLKVFDTTEFEVVDVLEAGGNDAGTAIFLLKAENFNFCARPTGSKELRAKYLNERNKLIGKKATIQHQGYTDAMVPRFPVMLNIRDYE